MAMDWVDCVGYGSQVLALPAGTYGAVHLLRASAEADHIEGEVEHTGDRLFIERIVGQIVLTSVSLNPVATTLDVAWRLMPLQQDVGQDAPEQPWADAGVVRPLNQGVFANLKWWDERRTQLLNDASLGAYPTMTSVDDPYWTHVDIRPRYLCGEERNVWPCLVVDHQTFPPQEADIVSVVPFLRLLVKH